MLQRIGDDDMGIFLITLVRSPFHNLHRLCGREGAQKHVGVVAAVVMPGRGVLRCGLKVPRRTLPLPSLPSSSSNSLSVLVGFFPFATIVGFYVRGGSHYTGLWCPLVVPFLLSSINTCRKWARAWQVPPAYCC